MSLKSHRLQATGRDPLSLRMRTFRKNCNQCVLCEAYFQTRQSRCAAVAICANSRIQTMHSLIANWLQERVLFATPACSGLVGHWLQDRNRIGVHLGCQLLPKHFRASEGLYNFAMARNTFIGPDSCGFFKPLQEDIKTSRNVFFVDSMHCTAQSVNTL